jgi:hypothetical protein
LGSGIFKLETKIYFEKISQFIENKRDCSGKIEDLYSEGIKFDTRLVYRHAVNRIVPLICMVFYFSVLYLEYYTVCLVVVSVLFVLCLLPFVIV